jgi:hypothetical protein
MTAHDRHRDTTLPPPSGRWTVARKAEVCRLISSGQITQATAMSAVPAEAGLGRSHDWRFGGLPMRTLPAQPRRASAQDLLGSVHVGVVGVVTVDALEDRLALAASGIHHTAGRARLRGVGGGNGDQRPTAFGKLVVELLSESAPALRKDGPVQSRLLAHIPAGLRDGAGGAGRHGADVQRLDRHQPETPRYFRRGAMCPVRADTGHSGIERGSPAPLGDVAPRTALPPRERFLCALPGLQQTRRVRRLHVLSGRERQSASDAAVNTNGGEGGRNDLLLYLASETHAPPARCRANGYAKQPPRLRPRVTELHPADLRKAHGRPLRIEPLETNVPTLKPERIVEAFSARLRVAGAAREERGHRLVKVSHRAIKRPPWDIRYPVGGRTQLGHLPALFDPCQRAARDAPELAPEVPALLKADIVDEPHRPDPLPQDRLLGARRLKPVAKTAVKHDENIAQTPLGSQSLRADELESWALRYQRFGEAGLRSTKVQELRP